MPTQNPTEYPNNLPTSTSISYPRRALQVDTDSASQFAPSAMSQRWTCLSRLRISLVMLLVTLSLITFIAWLVFHPHDPAFRLTSFTVSNITVSDSHFTANYDFEIMVDNTNRKVNLCIDHVKATVLYRGAMLSREVLGEVTCLRKMTREGLKVHLKRNSVFSVKNRVFKDISDDWSKKMVNFDLETSIRTRFESGIWPSKESFMKVLCVNLTVEFLTTKGTGKLLGGVKHCSVHVVQ